LSDVVKKCLVLGNFVRIVDNFLNSCSKFTRNLFINVPYQLGITTTYLN